MGTEGQVRAVAFKEGDVWVVHGVEYDIVTQTKDLLDAPSAFLKTLISTMVANQRLGRKGLEAVTAAPEKFRRMFESATMELTPTGPLPVKEEISRPNISLRAYRQLAGGEAQL
jgi:hypothetical protein